MNNYKEIQVKIKGVEVKVLMPWNNLGCFGVRCGRFYIDIFKRWGPWYRFGCFYSTSKIRGYFF